MPGSKPPNERVVSTYCYQCVAGPDLLTVRIQDGVATEINPNFKAAAIHPGGGQSLRQGLWAGAEGLQPQSRALPDEADQPEEGPQRGPGLRAHLLGRGARSGRRQIESHARQGSARRGRFPATGRELRRRRNSDRLHGHAAGLPRRLGSGRSELRLRAGRQVHALGTSLRRALASRLHRVPRHAAVRLRPLVRRQCRGLGRRVRGQASCRRAQPRHEARADRAASVDNRRLLGRMDSDQAEDRLRLPVRHDPCAAA